MLTQWRGFWARPAQLRPGSDGAENARQRWRYWLILAGRGFGKTRTISEDAWESVTERGCQRIALIAPTAADVRDVMIEGPSGIMNCGPRELRPTYEPSKRRVTWPNGAMAMGYSADEPDRLRGPQHDAAFCDEIATWPHAEEVWSNLLFGLRIGDPRVSIATTPRPTTFLKTLIRDPQTVVTRGTSFDNRSNLSPDFFTSIISKYEKTRLGRQEIYAEILEDTEGALWTRDMIDRDRVMLRDVPELARVVVAIDPAVSANEGSDETGIVIAGTDARGHAYVLEDRTGKYTPAEWVRKAVQGWAAWKGDRIVAEVNNGGDLVEAAIRSAYPMVPFTRVHASRGKAMRAEPVSALYERRLVHHVGEFVAMESQMCEWVPGLNMASPDRLDALVWALTELLVSPTPITGRMVTTDLARVQISPY